MITQEDLDKIAVRNNIIAVFMTVMGVALFWLSLGFQARGVTIEQQQKEIIELKKECAQ